MITMVTVVASRHRKTSALTRLGDLSWGSSITSPNWMLCTVLFWDFFRQRSFRASALRGQSEARSSGRGTASDAVIYGPKRSDNSSRTEAGTCERYPIRSARTNDNDNPEKACLALLDYRLVNVILPTSVFISIMAGRCLSIFSSARYLLGRESMFPPGSQRLAKDSTSSFLGVFLSIFSHSLLCLSKVGNEELAYHFLSKMVST